MGLMPFCREKFESSFKMVGLEVNYPLSELGVVIGFFLILLVEQSMLVCQNKRNGPYHEETKEMLETPNEYLIYNTSESDITGDSDSEYEVPKPASATLSTTAAAATEAETAAMLVSTSEQLNEQVKVDPASQNGHTLPSTGASVGKQQVRRARRQRTRSSKTSRSRHQAREQLSGHSHQHHGDGGHGHSHMLDALNQNSGLRCFILMIALGIHAIFEGMALGLQDQLAKLINLFIGVLVHECLVSFAMGISLARQKLRLATVIKLSVLLCAMIPVGIGIGLAIGVVHTFAGSLTSAILQAIAAGTFLYVIFLEILPAEINEPHDRLLKVFFLFFGFGLVACLQVATGGH